MARLKTLKDSDNEAAADVADNAAATPDAAPEAATETVEGSSAEATAESVTGDAPVPVPVPAPATTDASLSPALPATDNDPPAPAQPAPPADDGPIAEAQAAATAALERADRAEADFLAQSDKLAAANARIASLQEDLKAGQNTIDQLTATIAQRDAQIAVLGIAAPAPAIVTSIARPEPGEVLKLPEDGASAKWSEVSNALDQGAVLVLVLVNDSGAVQPFPAIIGGKALFTVQGNTLLYAGVIDLAPETALATVRHAVLLNDKGNVLSTCRLGALLIGGGGNSALIPGNNLRFAFA